MKIGIISMQRIVNYGSFLQAYGLKRTLEGLGHKVVFLDYKPGNPLSGKSGIVSSSKAYILKSKVGFILRYSAYSMMGLMSGKYRTKLSVVKAAHTMRQNYSRYLNKHLGINKFRRVTNEQVDLLVVGSDEVFNCLQSNPDVGYSLDLFGKDARTGRKVTYAASFGNTTLQKLEEQGVLDEISIMLKDFRYLSGRDANSVELLKQMTGKAVSKNIDPVLLYNFKQEIKTAKSRIHSLGIYMVVYVYAGRLTDDEISEIRRYAKKRSLKIVSLGMYNWFADYNINVDPFEVMAYVDAAQCVVTDTFHGTIYSIKMNTPFVTIVRQSVNGAYGNEEKLSDLLNTFNLESRRVSESEDIAYLLDTRLDFTDSNARILKEQEIAHKYLKEATTNEC